MGVAKIQINMIIPTNNDSFFSFLHFFSLFLATPHLVFYNIFALFHAIFTPPSRYLSMKKTVIVFAILILHSVSVFAQLRRLQFRPYTDLRPFHFGVVIGTHLQDLEFVNIGPQTITLEDGTVMQSNITVDQDRFDPGFSVGVLGELRLSKSFQFRTVPTLLFGTRHLVFRDHNAPAEKPEMRERVQDMRSAYLSVPFDLIYGSDRFNNHRPYIFAGLVPMLNLNAKNDDILRLKPYDLMVEVGFGCDIYLPYFKLRPELKLMYGIINNLKTDHEKEIRDKSLIPFTRSVSSSRSSIVALSFYFE